MPGRGPTCQPTPRSLASTDLTHTLRSHTPLRQNIKWLARATHQSSDPQQPPPPPNVRRPCRDRRRVGADQGRGTRHRRAPLHPRPPVRQEHAARLQDPRRGRRPPRHRRAQRPLALPGDGGVQEEGGVHLLPGAPLHLLLLLL